LHNTALVVNLHQSERDRLQHFLVQAGYHVLPTNTSEEALALCRDYKRTIHLLVADADLTGTSGWDLAERATALRPGIVILYLRGTSLSSKTLRFIGPKSHIAGTQAFVKGNMLLDVTHALIHKTQEKIQ
jgi:DNA-binding response OmpR family regulator